MKRSEVCASIHTLFKLFSDFLEITAKVNEELSYWILGGGK